MKLTFDLKYKHALFTALVLCAFKTADLLISNYPLRISHYYFPIAVGGMFGYIIGKTKLQLLQKISELKKTKEQLLRKTESLSKKDTEFRRKQRYLQAILDNTTAPVYLKDSNGKYLLINKMYEQLAQTTLEDAVGKTDHDIFPAHIAQLFVDQDREVIQKQQPLEFEETIELADGIHTFVTSKFPLFDAQNNVYAVGGLCTDITMKTQLEKEVIKVKKLESVAVLAGGIAHDFNNILTGIMGNISLAAKLISKNDEVEEILEDASKAARRASKLTKQLLTYSSGGDPVKKLTSIEHIIKESADFVLRGSNVKCSYDFSPDISCVEIDAAQISQVIQNLVLNSRNAMKKGCIISINCKNVHRDEMFFSDIVHEQYLKITISDKGEGIPKDIIDNIFDPYFTTRPNGSGLGLAIAYSIIKKHNGFISVSSQKRKGSVFKIYLPILNNNSSSITELCSEKTQEISKTEKHVLIMDDDALVRDIAIKILSHDSCSVVAAENGTDAVTLYKQNYIEGTPFDITILDLTVPGEMGGKEAAKQIREFDAEAYIVVSSGYAHNDIIVNYKKHGFNAVMVKPFVTEDLENIVFAADNRS